MPSLIPTDHLTRLSYNVKISFETEKGGGRMGRSRNKVEGVAFVLFVSQGEIRHLAAHTVDVTL